MYAMWQFKPTYTSLDRTLAQTHLLPCELLVWTSLTLHGECLSCSCLTITEKKEKKKLTEKLN